MRVEVAISIEESNDSVNIILIDGPSKNAKKGLGYDYFIE